MWAMSTLCFFGFFRMGELTIPNDKAYNYSIHLSPDNTASTPENIKDRQESQRHNSNCRQNKRPTMPSPHSSTYH